VKLPNQTQPVVRNRRVAEQVKNTAESTKRNGVYPSIETGQYVLAGACLALGGGPACAAFLL
jgi:hypothetical protein